uniref:Zinc finger CCHC-type containing 14 n=1 Tax=Leptobrachium leishanense TaxID=445787 RepID=A0A8C5PWV9_9ANUR
MVEKQRCPVQRDGVYRWFSALSSSHRIEFLCGLLDLCIPLELRFLGCCLEDLARKDYHCLRDAEIRANNPADLATLTNLTDEVVRSKLLVCLALLGCDNREAAGVLCRTLTHSDSIINNSGLQLSEGRTGDEFLLLFTMATNHPAFSFNQRQLLRKELCHIQGRQGAPCSKAPATCAKGAMRVETPSTPNTSVGNSLANALHTSAHSTDESLPKRPSGKHSKVNVEKIEVKVLPHKKKEKNSDCCFEVLWSDSSVSLVSKSSAEIIDLILKLSHLFPEENLEKCIPYGVRTDSFSAERNHVDLELDLRYLVSLPSHVLKSDLVKKFFSNSPSHQTQQNTNPSSTPHLKVNTLVGASIRPICGVASIQSSQSSITSHHSSVILSPCSHAGSTGSTSLVYRPAVEATSSVISSNLSGPQTEEQQEILEWLRKLRLHKYYSVFSQLSMKKFLSLTEEDLNKFESLTTGAKKKLKTQLELEKEKSEKRCLNPAPCSSYNSSGGVARVPPTSHVGPVQNIHCSHSAELSVDVEAPNHPMPQEGSSFSDYSSSPSSPMGLQAREESSDSAEEMDKRLGRHLDCGEKEKSILLVNHFTSNSVRPTAQVLPVQNDTGSNPAGHHPLPLQIMTVNSSHMAPIHLMNTMHKPERANTELKLLQSSSHSLLSSEERSKGSAGLRGSIKLEKNFSNMVLDVKGSSSSLQPTQVLPVMTESNTIHQTVGFGFRTRLGTSASGDRVLKPGQQPALMVDSSAPATIASTPIFHVARTPVKLLVSESSLVGQTTGTSVSPAIITPRNLLYTANTKVAFSAMSGLPVAQMPGNFCANSTASSGTYPSSFSNMANLQSCPAPSSSPTNSSASETSFYSGSGSTPSVNIHITNPTPNHHHVHHQQPQQQAGCSVCSSCGCSGSCGSGSMTVNYGNYFQHPFSGPSVFPFSLLPFNPVCNNGYINTQQYSNSATFPVVHAPYNSTLNPDTMLTGQPGFTLPPMQNYLAGTAGVYQPQGMMASINGTAHKKNGNLSCYNCGASGHRAQDCKQPSMDFNQQGTFRLKYAPPPDGLDSAD